MKKRKRNQYEVIGRDDQIIRDVCVEIIENRYVSDSGVRIERRRRGGESSELNPLRDPDMSEFVRLEYHHFKMMLSF